MELWRAFLNIRFEHVSSMSSGEWPVKCCIFGMRFVSSVGYHMTTRIDGFIWLITSYKNTSKLVCKLCCHQRVLTFKGSSYHCKVYVIVSAHPQQVLEPLFTWFMRLELYWTSLITKRKWKCGCIYQWWSNTWYIFDSRSFVRGQICIPPFPVMCWSNWKSGYDILVGVTFDIISYK